MTQFSRPTLAASNKNPIPSRGFHNPELSLVFGECALSTTQPVPELRVPPETVRTLQAILRAEKAFLEDLRAIAKEKCGHRDDFEKFQRNLNHDNVLHVARFYFLLSELDCTTSDAIDALIEAHNDKIDVLIEEEDFRTRTLGELKKAKFSRYQRLDCVESVGWSRRPAFMKSEITCFLFEHMGRTAAESMIDDMVDAGLLEETTYSPKGGADRQLLKANGKLENAVRTYLEGVWTAIKHA